MGETRTREGVLDEGVFCFAKDTVAVPLAVSTLGSGRRLGDPVSQKH